MIVAVHQPNYIPWMGYFYKIYKSDVFVILDDVQYVKRSYINRNRIKTHQGELWLTVPVSHPDNSRCGINEVILKNDLNWKENHLKNIEASYKKAEFFNHYYDQFKSTLLQDCDRLCDLNLNMIQNICGYLDIQTEILLSSQLHVEGCSTERIINLCKALGADEYLSGTGGSKYQDEASFKQNAIKLTYSDFDPKPYKQLWGQFAGNLSIVDYLFNCGPDVKKFWETGG